MSKLRDSQIPVGPARTRWGRCCKPARLHTRGAPGSSAAVHALHHPPPRRSAVPQFTSESSNLKTTPMGTAPPAISRGTCLLTRVRRWVRRLCRSLTDVGTSGVRVAVHDVSPHCSAGASPGAGLTAAIRPVCHSRASGDSAANPPGSDSSSGVPHLGLPIKGSPASVPDHSGRGPARPGVLLPAELLSDRRFQVLPRSRAVAAELPLNRHPTHWALPRLLSESELGIDSPPASVWNVAFRSLDPCRRPALVGWPADNVSDRLDRKKLKSHHYVLCCG
jgi:hypothetical protein